MSFKEIQFRFDLARGATTTTSPVLEWFAFEYMRINPTVWGYQFTVDCTKVYAKKTPADLIDAVRTVTALGTLATFSFRNGTGGTETYRCKVWDVSGDVQTGTLKEGQFRLMVVAP